MPGPKGSRESKMMIAKFRKERVEVVGRKWGRRRQGLPDDDVFSGSLVVGEDFGDLRKTVGEGVWWNGDGNSGLRRKNGIVEGGTEGGKSLYPAGYKERAWETMLRGFNVHALIGKIGKRLAVDTADQSKKVDGVIRTQGDGRFPMTLGMIIARGLRGGIGIPLFEQQVIAVLGEDRDLLIDGVRRSEGVRQRWWDKEREKWRFAGLLNDGANHRIYFGRTPKYIQHTATDCFDSYPAFPTPILGSDITPSLGIVKHYQSTSVLRASQDTIPLYARSRFILVPEGPFCDYFGRLKDRR
ncbi:hypothetical protein C8J57DRAFT_1224036 [Mycena rebaudengoi]|nr:hypothetical protein C8J57DRAFT_1224036 [Mycena rebaudengoi]